MNSIEAIAATCLVHGWRLVLAFTAATLCVALLRRPCRRLFGAQRAYHLWLLPPLAMLASQWPHVAPGLTPLRRCPRWCIRLPRRGACQLQTAPWQTAMAGALRCCVCGHWACGWWHGVQCVCSVDTVTR